ncbi:MAG TPA: sigma-70 family RNA polymerase sigma factor [Kofleriaceae bacterium]|jgi:RNA polymerase sigma factor (sigma-70 family)
MSDEDLVAACRRGDRAAFAALIERHARMVAAVAFAASGDGALVDDVVQDTFVAAWQRLATLRDASAVRPWLRRIATNLARKARRRRVRETGERDIASDDTPFDAAVARERAQQLDSALARLGPRYREPLVLFYYEQQSIREVASALRLNEAAVMQRLSRARKQLGEALDADLRADLSRRSVATGAAVLAVLAIIGDAKPAAAATIGAATYLRFAAAIGVVAAAGWLLARSDPTAVSSTLAAEQSNTAAASRSGANHAASPPNRVPSVPQLPDAPAAAPPRSAPPAPGELAIEGVPHGSSAGSGWANRVIRNVIVAGNDPVETCRRGVHGLALAALSPPDGHGTRMPDERIDARADEIAAKFAPSCDGQDWPELWTICEASPVDVLDGNVNCYPYDVFD